MLRRLLVLSVLLVLPACGGESGPGADAGRSADGGVTADAGIKDDAGVTADAGDDSDGGDATDAGDTTDAGTTCEGYVESGVCHPFKPCAPGTFVSRQGTASMDRECAPCEPGTFSSSENLEACTPLTTCAVVETEGTPSTDRICAYDCEIEWTEWTCCNASSGGSTAQTRTGTVTKPASSHGSCTSTLTESRACAMDAPHCPCDTQLYPSACAVWNDCSWDNALNACIDTPIDCEYSAWTEWSQCSEACEYGTQTRTRTIVRQPANGGKACDGPLEATQACNSGILCECSEIMTELRCNNHTPACLWRSGVCGPPLSCDELLTEDECNAHLESCEWIFGTCVPH